MGSRCPQQQRASICGRGARAPRDLARKPQPHSLQCAKANRSAECRFRQGGARGRALFEEIGVPPDADFYIYGPAAFMSGLVDGLAGWGVARDRLHTENFGSGQSKTPGIAAVPRRPPVRRGSRGSRPAYILYAQQSRCPLGFRIPQPARASRGVRCAGALVVPHRSLS